MPAFHRKVLEGLGIHDPTVVGNLAPLIVLELSEVPLNHWVLPRDLFVALNKLEVPYLTLQVV
jgi:hypothetical protein